LGKIFFGVVNDVVCADRARHLQIPRAAHGSHFRSKRLGNLYRKRPHPARRPVDQNLLPGLNMPMIAQALQGQVGLKNAAGIVAVGITVAATPLLYRQKIVVAAA
jgi:hypothetical protein